MCLLYGIQISFANISWYFYIGQDNINLKESKYVNCFSQENSCREEEINFFSNCWQYFRAVSTKNCDKFSSDIMEDSEDTKH